MRFLGIILIVVGLLMFIFRSFNYTKKEKVIDAGPLEINRKENKSVSWPMYAGGLAVVAGIILIVADKKKP